MKKKMKTAQKASGAAAYVSGSVDLKVRTDHYTHSTVLRTPLKTDDGPRSGGSVFQEGKCCSPARIPVILPRCRAP